MRGLNGQTKVLRSSKENSTVPVIGEDGPVEPHSSSDLFSSLPSDVGGDVISQLAGEGCATLIELSPRGAFRGKLASSNPRESASVDCSFAIFIA